MLEPAGHCNGRFFTADKIPFPLQLGRGGRIVRGKWHSLTVTPLGSWRAVGDMCHSVEDEALWMPAGKGTPSSEDSG